MKCPPYYHTLLVFGVIVQPLMKRKSVTIENKHKSIIIHLFYTF